MFYIQVLLENTSLCDDIQCRHGLSVYVRTPNHTLLFDAGPDDAFLRNAEKLGIDLARVDTAVLSHGHHDHGGGLETFFQINQRAMLYLHPLALDGYYSQARSVVPRYIGLEPSMENYRDRMIFVQDTAALDSELLLFQAARSQTPLLIGNSKLRRLCGTEYIQDDFRHELNMLIMNEGKAVLLAGCAHNGIVPIMERCTELLGRAPDIALGGFHLFSPGSGETEPEEVIRRIGEQLSQWPTIYYTGHCTGQLAFDQLKNILGEQLHHIHSGLTLQI